MVQSGNVPTSIGSITPLTLERFRICELYAELLHCSNMSLLNRPTGVEYQLYDSGGYLAGGWRAVEKLSDALSGYRSGEEDRIESRIASPVFPPQHSVSSPIDLAPTYSGTSTPSGAGSLDSESGILTKAEAKELRDLLASSAANPFDDPHNDMIELGEAIGSIRVDSNGSHGANPPERRRTISNGSNLPAGQLLKQQFIEHRIISTMLVRSSVSW